MILKCLSLGAGNDGKKRKLFLPNTADATIEWTTLDADFRCRPDILFNLNSIEQPSDWTTSDWITSDGYTTSMIPCPSGSFDEIHAYSVMGLYGQQGNAEGFFKGMQELWRILKPGGLFVGGSPAPSDRWAWGEPSAKRIINDATFLYLTREFYNKLGGQALSDYRNKVEPCWWTIEHSEYGSVGDCQTYHWVLKKEVV